MKKHILIFLSLILVSCQPSSSDTKSQLQTPPPVTDQGEDTPPTPTLTPEFTYPSCEELNVLWKTRYHKQLKISWPLQEINCAGPSKDRSFAEAAYILEKTVFNLNELPAGVNPPPADMLTFVTSKYRELRIGKDAFPSTDVVNKILYFYPAVENENGFTVVGNLVHEARHADGYYHIKCLSGPNKGVEMCDMGIGDSFYVGGPHRVALLYFAWAAARSNWPADWKNTARTLTEALVRTRINASDDEISAWIAKYLSAW